MNVVEDVVDVYDKNTDKVGIVEQKSGLRYTLLPIFHTTVTAQIEVTIDESGNFIRAQIIEVSDKMTIIPVTEKSGSRTAGKEPHPLCDNLRYLAGDYKDYCDDDGICYDMYIAQLKQWSESEFSHDKVAAIYTYLSQKTLIKDLLNQHILTINEQGKLDEKENIQGISQTKAFVRFIVRSHDMETVVPEECWRDQTLFDCYIKYYRSQEKEKGLCYLTGKEEKITYLHSKKIRNEGDGAKLISANDSQNFTYRGRFAEKEEAFAVGIETSQKFHNALKWLIRKQGETFDTVTFVTWESSLQKMPRWNASTLEIIDDGDDDEELDEELGEVEEHWDGNEPTARAFYKAMRGYGKKVHNTSNMILLGFDAATTGRLALIEEKQMESARYLKNIAKWHESCKWIYKKSIKGDWKEFWGIVGINDIADILFGIENNGILTIVDSNGKKLYAEVAKRLLPCIWDGQQIPHDYVQRAELKASQPLNYKKRENWELILSLACSFVKKERKEREKEEWNVALDKKCKNRNYLYGRLLAVADRVEYRTYDMEKDGSRVTNAKRYMSTFSMRPFETWKVIEENLQPYLNKLNFPERKYYENLIDDICNTFELDEYYDNSRLDGRYLLGFHSQSYDMKQYKQDKKETEE